MEEASKSHAEQPAVDRRIRKTRKAIRDALEVLLRQENIDQISIKQISSQADIGYTTFFRHFASKELALADLVDCEAREIASKCFLQFACIKAPDAMVLLCEQIEQRREMWTALFTGGAANLLRRRLIDYAAEGEFRLPQESLGLPIKAGAALFIGLCLEVFQWWLLWEPKLTPEQVAVLLNRMFYRDPDGAGDEPAFAKAPFKAV